MSNAPKINYEHLAPVVAERDRAHRACEQMGARMAFLRSALLKITAIIETQTDPDIDAIHDVAREALVSSAKSVCSVCDGCGKYWTETERDGDLIEETCKTCGGSGLAEK